MSKNNLLVSISTLAISAIMASTDAHAAVTTQIFGGGSSLMAPYFRQAADCYGNPTNQLIQQGSWPYGVGSETFATVASYNYTGAAPQNCATTHIDPTTQINLVSSSSGNGELSIFTHDLTTDVGTTTDGVHGVAFTGVQFGTSEFGVGLADVNAYNNGGVIGQVTGGKSIVTILAPGVGGASGYTYANPVAQYGNFIEFPIAISSVAVTYSSTYQVNVDSTGTATYYHFNIQNPNADGSGGLRLTMPTLCAIFNGAITDWNDPELQVLNGGVSLQDPSDPTTPWSLPIELVGRTDNSGATATIYRALAAQCKGKYTEPSGTKKYTNNYAATGGVFVPAALNSGQVYLKTAIDTGPNSGVTPVKGKFTTATGASTVAKYLAFTYKPPVPGSGVATWRQGRLGYGGTAYALPAVINTGLNTYGLNVADLLPTVLGATAYIEPTAATSLLAYGQPNTIKPPQSNATGGYAPTTTGFGLRSAPSDWVDPISTTFTYSNGTKGQSLAVPKPAGAYPIVGTANVLLNTCYASSAPQLVGFLNYVVNSPVLNDPATGIFASAGLGPLPKVWATAITQTFLTPTVKKGATIGTDSLNLNILNAGTAAAATGYGGQCATVTPGA